METSESQQIDRYYTYLTSILAVSIATGLFWLIRIYVDGSQASLLYLPVVIGCAIRLGFGPAVFSALLSFFCWDYFFLPPFHTFGVTHPKDWLALVIFLIAAITTSQLAAQARQQAKHAKAREDEITTLFQASEAINHEISVQRLLSALTEQIQTLCGATLCIAFQAFPPSSMLRMLGTQIDLPSEEQLAIQKIAQTAFDNDQMIGFDASPRLWTKAMRETKLLSRESKLGAYIPLHSAAARVGVLYVGPRRDGRDFTPIEQRLILTLANHAATVIARDALAAEAAEATALRATDNLKDSLLSLVSHELRTPLASIKASATGLLQKDAKWEASSGQEALRAINRETDRLSALVSNLLDLSRLEAGAWQPNKDWCDLIDIFATTLDHFGSSDAARIDVEVKGSLPLIRADYVQIALVVQNLVENALKYSPGDRRISLEASPAEIGNRPGTIVRVRDFGDGIAAGEEERLFTRFYRGKRHQDTAIHGTGLGLALCWAIVQGHGGQIWAGNAPPDQPKGAIFSVFLPIDSEDIR